MRPARTCFAILALVTAICGCNATWQKFQRPAPPPGDSYREMALKAEKQGHIQEALLAWRVAEEIEKDDSAAEAIEKLEQRIAKASNYHFQKGLKYYQSGDHQKALKAFLITLRFDPDHQRARFYIKNRLQAPEQPTYTVKAGDSYTRIASKVYKDPDKAFIIAHFNDMDPRKPLMIGTPLQLPDLGQKEPQGKVVKKPVRPKRKRKPKKDTLLDQAQAAYEKKHYKRVIALSRKILQQNPDHTKARRLADAVHYQWGLEFLEQKQYAAAVEQFSTVSPGYKGRNQALAKARSHISDISARKELGQAQQYLRDGNWDRVIQITEKVLAANPSNAQAKMLFSNASYNKGQTLLDRGAVVQAVELLSRIDPSYEDTEHLLALARARMKSQAEAYYRNGVKHYINEDLQLAIKAWKRTLELNPQHPKAQKDIENAERLLDRLKGLDQKSTP